MAQKRNRWQQNIFALGGWLFADLLLVLTLIFLATSAPWQIAQGGPTVTVTPTPVLCGLDSQFQEVTVTVSDPYGLRRQTRSAFASFARDLQRSALSKSKGRVAGLVEVFGGNPNSVGDGTNFAKGAIAAMKTETHSHFIFSPQTAFFKPLWTGGASFNQLVIYVFYYAFAQKCA